jgi:hypothetical protein
MLYLLDQGVSYSVADDEHPMWEAVRFGQPAAVLEQLLVGGLSVEYARGGVRLLQLALESGNAPKPRCCCWNVARRLMPPTRTAGRRCTRLRLRPRRATAASSCSGRATGRPSISRAGRR